MKRWDLMVSRKLENGGYSNTRVGTVFENDKGNLAIKLDAGFALVNAVGVSINGFVPRPREGWAPHKPAQQDLPKSDADDSEWG